MKRNKGTDKALSAGASILFVGLIQSSDANHVALAALTVGLYEVCLLACRIARREANKDRKRHYITVSQRDIRRWSDTWIGHPMKEVN